MPRGIIIFGSAGAGKTTLGKLVAQQLNYPYFDIDDYIGKKDGSPCLKTHLEWADTLPCKVLYLNGEDELAINVKLIVDAYRGRK